MRLRTSLALTFAALTLVAQPTRTVVKGHIPAKARAEFDQGAVDSSFKLPAITVQFKRSADQQAALEKLLAEQQDPSSANYHKWLTPDEYASRFGISNDDLARVKTWVESNGFTIQEVGRTRSYMVVSGTAQQVRGALGTTIHRYNVKGEAHYANATAPAIPADLGGLVATVQGLHDFKMKPRSVKARMNPEYNVSGSHQMAPDDLAMIYNIKPLYDAGIDGTGQKIVVVGQTAISQTDIDRFRTKFGLSAANLQVVRVPGRPNPGTVSDDLGEADLDIEWSGAVARNATIIYVYSDDVQASLEYAVDQNLAPVISMSYGSCEGGDLVDLPSQQATAQKANALGITWLAASGDAGAADCEDYTATIAQNGLAVDVPGVIPEVTSMGGSELDEGTGTSYWGANATTGLGSALSYIPEKVWNDSALDGAPSAGGGGKSTFFLRPAWQTANGLANDSFRHVPDISFSSSADHVGYYVYSGGSASYYGGTSVAAPVMAGVVALLNQYLLANGKQAQAGVGNINPHLYRLAQVAPDSFHDIVNGDNKVPCVAGSPSCINGLVGHSAGPGYDDATGLGSPNAANLVHNWAANPATKSAVAATLDSIPVFQQGSGWPFTLTLTEEAGIPTTVTKVVINGQAVNIAQAFGTASIPARGSISASNISVSKISVPGEVTFDIEGVDADGTPWIQNLSVPFSSARVALSAAGAGNAASGEAAYAPGMIVSVYGTNMGAFAQSAGTIPLPQFLAGFEAWVNDVPAPIYYVSPNQVNIQIPYETAPGRATLSVGNPWENFDLKITVSATAPGIFMTNGFVSQPFSTAARGSITTMFITGEGKVKPSVATGTSPSRGQTPTPTGAVSITVGGVPVATPFQYIGIPNGLVGVTQINFQVPPTVPVGTQPVVVTVGNASSAPANLTVTP